MTRIAPTLTLLAVAALGGGMYVANATTDPTTQLPPTAPAAVVAPAAAGTGATQISLAGIPVAGATGATEISLAGLPVVGGTGAAAAAGTPTEISLAGVPVAGGSAGATAPGRAEISLADIAVAQPGKAPAAASAGSATAFAGDTSDGTMTVAVAEEGGKAVAYVCDGENIEAWLNGPATGGALSLQSKSGRSTLTGTATSGTVTIDGKDFPYTAKATDVAGAAKIGRGDVGQVVARLGQAG